MSEFGGEDATIALAECQRRLTDTSVLLSTIVNKAMKHLDPLSLNRVVDKTTMAWFLEHREGDKQIAIRTIEGEIATLNTQMASIKRLGGVPKKKTLKQLAEAKTQLAAIKRSNPLATMLY